MACPQFENRLIENLYENEGLVAEKKELEAHLNLCASCLEEWTALKLAHRALQVCRDKNDAEVRCLEGRIEKIYQKILQERDNNDWKRKIATPIFNRFTMTAKPWGLMAASIFVAAVLGFYVKSRNEYVALSNLYEQKHKELSQLKRQVNESIASSSKSLKTASRPIQPIERTFERSLPVDVVSARIGEASSSSDMGGFFGSFPMSSLMSVSMPQKNFDDDIKTQWFTTKPFMLRKGQYALLPSTQRKLHLKDILYSPCATSMTECTWSGVGALYEFDQKILFVKKPFKGFPALLPLDGEYELEILDIQPMWTHAILKKNK